jgi:hypothetical protein
MRVVSFLFLVVFAGGVGLFAYQNRAQDVAVTVWDRTWLVNLPIMVAALFAAGMFGGWAIVGMLRRSWRRVTEPGHAR